MILGSDILQILHLHYCGRILLHHPHGMSLLHRLRHGIHRTAQKSLGLRPSAGGNPSSQEPRALQVKEKWALENAEEEKLALLWHYCLFLPSPSSPCRLIRGNAKGYCQPEELTAPKQLPRRVWEVSKSFHIPWFVFSEDLLYPFITGLVFFSYIYIFLGWVRL